MKYFEQSSAGFAVSSLVSIGMTVAASRQLFLFVGSKNSPGLLEAQGGRIHLWFALGALAIAAVASGLMFLFYLGHEKIKAPKPLLNSLQPRTDKVKPSSRGRDRSRDDADRSKWARMNGWTVEGQANDRTPVNGAVESSSGSASARRSSARRNHQMMYREWSDARSN